MGNGWRQFLKQFHGGVHPGAALGGGVNAPGHGDGATAVEDADDDGGALISLESGVEGQSLPVLDTGASLPERHQARTQRSSGAKQRVTSSRVWQGLVRSLPS